MGAEYRQIDEKFFLHVNGNLKVGSIHEHTCLICQLAYFYFQVTEDPKLTN